jgi:sucrose-phosphate synthase
MPLSLPYIQMFSVHGLLRAENLELGRDADTGGQIKYVLELARHLSHRGKIGRIDLFTRLIKDKRVSADYARPVEEINDKLRIIRIQCGGRKYMRKELLWPHLAEFTDKTIKFIKRENQIPDIVHGHYPDAGYVAMQLASVFGLPFIYTGHSLGRAKLSQAHRRRHETSGHRQKIQDQSTHRNGRRDPDQSGYGDHLHPP